jgi:adenosine deaminase
MRRRTASLSILCCVIVALATLTGCRCNSGDVQGLRSKAEKRAGRVYDADLREGPEALRAFLADFPKGADLHIHLSGAIYAETFIRDAAEDHLCIDPVKLAFARDSSNKVMQEPCGKLMIPASHLNGSLTPADMEFCGKLFPQGLDSGYSTSPCQALYDKLLDSFSLRSFVPSAGWNGHDQFFATFDKFSEPNKTRIGEWVDEVASRAAAQNEQYLELMQTPPFGHAAQIAHQIGWNPQLNSGDPAAFAQFRQALLDQKLSDEFAPDRDNVIQAEVSRKNLEHCGTPQATPACKVTVRYIYQVLRGNPPEQVFAQALLGFETVTASMDAGDNTWVGINFVQPEDGFLSMRDYTLQMKMVAYLHSVYPKVNISLHAGELALGIVPPEGLRFHIRQAVEIAGAERIGHGVDVMDEDNAHDLLKELAGKHVMVEINLSSNEGILGVKGNQHPFPQYLEAHVPVALSTDDEGVSRIDLTNEYVRAANDYDLTYRDLKQLARTGIEHSFLPGADLWAKPDDFSSVVPDCRQSLVAPTSAACVNLLHNSQKASAEMELEQRFIAFEARFKDKEYEKFDKHGQ